jgi:hypothetical protein
LERQRPTWSQIKTATAHLFTCQLLFPSKHSIRHPSHTKQVQMDVDLNVSWTTPLPMQRASKETTRLTFMNNVRKK